MSKSIQFLSLAQKEMDDSFEYYEQQVSGLGHDFLAEILACLKRIQQNPAAWQVFSDHSRRCLVSRFPYGIIYREEVDKILVLAVAHLHRKPAYWNNRIS